MADNDFNFPEYLTDLFKKYAQSFSDTEKEKVIANIRHEKDNPNEVYYLSDLAGYPDKEWLDKKTPSEAQDEKLLGEAKEIIDNLRNGNGKINQDLNDFLNKTDLVIKIRPDWDKPNGGMVLNKEKQQAILLLPPANVIDQYDKILPGIISHEMGHLVDFYQRPQAPAKEITCSNGEKITADPNKLSYMDGTETATDALGEMLAQNAGYSCRTFGKYMGEESRAGNNPPNTAPGDLREKNIEDVRGIMNKNRLISLRGLSSTKVPYKPSSAKINLQTLRLNRNNNGR